MKKLNNKGYITVEIIIASVITFAIAFFLIDITANVVSDTDDAYIETVLLTDKALIIKNIKKQIEDDIKNHQKVKTILTSGNDTTETITITYYDNTKRYLSLDSEQKSITYEYNNQVFYRKKLDDSLSNLSLTGGKYGDYVYFKITADNIFTEQNNDINIIVYNG